MELSKRASPLPGECLQGSTPPIPVQITDGKYKLSRKQALLDMGESDELPACCRVGHIARYCPLACCSLRAFRRA